MRKVLSLILALLLALALTAGCGQSGDSGEDAGTEAVTLDTMRTLGEVYALEGAEFSQYGFDDDQFVYVFQYGGDYYRVVCPMTPELNEAGMAIDWGDEDHDDKLMEIVGGQEIQRLDNLSESIPAQEELDVFVGKTLGELKEAGWTNSGWNLDDMEFWMDYGPFCYTVVVEGEVADPDAVEDEDMDPLVVKSVTWMSIGDATDLEE